MTVGPNDPTERQEPVSGYTVGPGSNWPNGARLPIPGNAEWVLWALAVVLVAIVAGISDRVDAPQWVEFFKWTTAAYLISRGIAKASRVLEQ
ncbi:MAG: hypothetical protein LC685_02090 [Actinobacteria bacterium]|nr:hypothetical protein [Actinomycetota bacterium]